jgi:hypothetical protein
MVEKRTEYKAGHLREDICCRFCGEPVSIDAQGMCLCYSCGKFVDSIPVSMVRKFKRGDDIQIPLFKNGWDMPV